MADKHITEINATLANMISNLDDGQCGQLTDQNKELIYRIGSTFYMIPPCRSTLNGSAFTYLDIEADDITAQGNLTCGEYLYHYGDTSADTYRRLREDRQTDVCGGVTFLDMVEDTQDLFEVNPNQTDIDFTVNTNGLEALAIAGDTGAAVFGSTVQATAIGIGKAAGTYQLDLQALAGSTGQRIYCYSDDVAHSPFISTYKSHADTATNTETIDTELLFQLRMRGVDSGSNADMGAEISVYQEGAAGTKVPCYMVFYTSTNSATVERMRIASTGLVTMDYGLDVDGGVLLDGDVCIEDSVIYLGATTTTANKWRVYDDGTNLLFQRYESSSWVTKATVVA